MCRARLFLYTPRSPSSTASPPPVSDPDIKVIALSTSILSRNLFFPSLDSAAIKICVFSRLSAPRRGWFHPRVSTRISHVRSKGFFFLWIFTWRFRSKGFRSLVEMIADARALIQFCSWFVPLYFGVRVAKYFNEAIDIFESLRLKRFCKIFCGFSTVWDCTVRVKIMAGRISKFNINYRIIGMVKNERTKRYDIKFNTNFLHCVRIIIAKSTI